MLLHFSGHRSPLAAFKFFCLSLIWTNLLMLCHDVIFLMCLVFEVVEILVQWVYSFHHIQKSLGHYIFKYFFSVPPSLSSILGSNYTYIKLFEFLPEKWSFLMVFKKKQNTSLDIRSAGIFLKIILIFFGCIRQHAGFSLPNQESHALQQKSGVLNSELPGKSP